MIFVSVDPDRDTPEKIKKFLKYFPGKFIGVTGLKNDDPSLKEMLRKFKIYATKIEYEQEIDGKDAKSYTIDHTVLSYLMSDNNKYLDHLGSSLNAKDLSKKIIDSVMEREHNKIYN